MKLIHLVAALAVIGMTGVVQAQPQSNDASIFRIDLEQATGKAYFLYCEGERNILRCEQPSLWEQSNGYPGLQVAPLPVGASTFVPEDQELLS